MPTPDLRTEEEVSLFGPIFGPIFVWHGDRLGRQADPPPEAV